MVSLNRENIGKCNCTFCPVQAKSVCAKNLKAKLTEAMKTMEEGRMTMMTPMPDTVPNVYCSTGKATCKDLDFSKNCICPTCKVFKEYNLIAGKPVKYYCSDGKSI